MKNNGKNKGQDRGSDGCFLKGHKVRGGKRRSVNKDELRESISNIPAR